MKSSSAAIFFDGASKGNPGILGAGGFVTSFDGLVEFSFRWGLEIMSNNQDECYNLLMVIQVAKENVFKSIQVFDDSEMLIKALNSCDCFNNSSLNKSLQRIRHLLKEFVSVVSFHILRKLNNFVDALANNQLPNQQIVASKTKLLIVESVGKTFFSPSLDVSFSKWLGFKFCETRSVACIKPASVIP